MCKVSLSKTEKYNLHLQKPDHANVIEPKNMSNNTGFGLGDQFKKLGLKYRGPNEKWRAESPDVVSRLLHATGFTQAFPSEAPLPIGEHRVFDHVAFKKRVAQHFACGLPNNARLTPLPPPQPPPVAPSSCALSLNVQ